MFSQGKIAESQSESLGLVLKTTAHGPRTGTQYQREQNRPYSQTIGIICCDLFGDSPEEQRSFISSFSEITQCWGTTKTHLSKTCKANVHWYLGQGITVEASNRLTKNPRRKGWGMRYLWGVRVLKNTHIFLRIYKVMQMATCLKCWLS